MGISRKQLNADESVVVSTRKHAKALLGPLLLLMLLAAAAGFVISFTPSAGRAAPLLQAVVWLVAALLAAKWVLPAFLGWLTTRYTITDRRVIVRRGMLRRTRDDVPISALDGVTYERSLVERVLGCGTLVLSIAGRGRWELRDVPRVEEVHLTVEDILSDNMPTRVVDRRGLGDR